MPGRFKFRKTRRFRSKRRIKVRPVVLRRKSTRRSKAPNLNRVSISRFGLGFNQSAQLKCKLRYIGFVGATTTLTFALQQVRGNGLFDPDATGIGHQPKGFDRISALYSRYYVGASKITVRPVVNTSNANAIICLECVPGVNQANSSAIDVVMERKTVTYRFMQQQSNTKAISQYATTHGVFGVSKLVTRADMDSEYGALTTADPASVWVWNIYVQNADLASSTNFQIWYEIDYYCTFMNRITPQGQD